MRLIRTTIFSISLIAFLASCENPTPDNSYEMKLVDSLDAQRDNKNATPSHTNADTLASSSNQPDTSNVLHGQDRSKLYQDLGMTDDQIQRFEEDFGRKVNAIKTHGRGDYTAQDVENQEGQSMNAVLSKDQYKNYLDWKESHTTSKN